MHPAAARDAEHNASVADRHLRGVEARTAPQRPMSGRMRRQLAHEAREHREASIAPLVRDTDGGTIEGRILSALLIKAMTPYALAEHIGEAIEDVAPACMKLLEEGELRKLPETRPAVLERVIV